MVPNKVSGGFRSNETRCWGYGCDVPVGDIYSVFFDTRAFNCRGVSRSELKGPDGLSSIPNHSIHDLL